MYRLHNCIYKQEAQLSQRDRAMFRVIEYFARGHSRSFEMTPLSIGGI